MAVTFTISIGNEQLSFRSISEITDLEAYEKISRQMLHWSQSVRESAIRSQIVEKFGQELACQALIAFKSKSL
ncbi:hypothetical protein LSG31_00140 [Fodinisporobacter ferrooxydans]|uniref:Uncharacterized protein n=1 Tax=Fodinisporobacter ferrooxydans TaxID=2901836 RepID=A0ABY4CMR2_9BACL|nr:hypothetical protein LSG31_00140 [Alicyclobacillaceae bacterium MYW30-H2]